VVPIPPVAGACVAAAVVVGLMSYLPYLCLFAHSGVQHILCCVFVSFFFILLQVSLDCPFLIAPKKRWEYWDIPMCCKYNLY
jgi:hypothetical protein